MLISSIDSKENPCLITPWFFIHFLAGGVLTSIFKNMGYSDKSVFTAVLFFHTAYEIKDYHYTYNYSEQHHWHGNNTILNSIGDTIACILGYFVFQNTKFSSLFVSYILLHFMFVYFKVEKK